MQNTELKKQNKLITACFLLITFTVASKLVYLFSLSVFANDSLSALDKSVKQSVLLKNGITFYYFFYGLTQIILSLTFEKINVKKYLLITTLISCLLTFSLYFSFSDLFTCLTLCLTGIFQAGVWCCSVSLLTSNLRFSALFRANAVLTCAFPLGGACACLTVFLCGLFNCVKFSFVVSALLILFACVFLFCCLRSFNNESVKTAINQNPVENKHELKPVNENFGLSKTLKKRYANVLCNEKSKTLYIVLIGLSATLSYSVYSCVTDYAPLMLKYSFNVSNGCATALSVFVPISATVGGIITIYLCRINPDCYFVAMLFSFLTTAFALCLMLFGCVNLALTVVLSVAYAIFSKSVCSVFETVVIAQTKNIISSGGFSAYTNACSSLGALLSSVIVCSIIKKGITFLYGCVVIATLILCFLTLNLFMMFYKSKNHSLNI